LISTSSRHQSAQPPTQQSCPSKARQASPCLSRQTRRCLKMEHRLQRSNETLNILAPDYSTCVRACPSMRMPNSACCTHCCTHCRSGMYVRNHMRGVATRPPVRLPAYERKYLECHVRVWSGQVLYWEQTVLVSHVSLDGF
jgi:hypothetical protein